jgi:acyl carrier protein
MTVMGDGKVTTKATILDEIVRIAEQQGKTLAPVTDDLRLLDSGLDSLCLAVLVASLDDILGIDPFDSESNVPFPITIGDLIALYENAPA